MNDRLRFTYGGHRRRIAAPDAQNELAETGPIGSLDTPISEAFVTCLLPICSLQLCITLGFQGQAGQGTTD